MPYGITQCYLPPGRGDSPAFTPAEAGIRSNDPGDAKLSWPSWLVTYWDRMYTRPKTVTHPSTNRARRALTSFMRRTPLTTAPHSQPNLMILCSCGVYWPQSSSKVKFAFCRLITVRWNVAYQGWHVPYLNASEISRSCSNDTHIHTYKHLITHTIVKCKAWIWGAVTSTVTLAY